MGSLFLFITEVMFERVYKTKEIVKLLMPRAASESSIFANTGS